MKFNPNPTLPEGPIGRANSVLMPDKQLSAQQEAYCRARAMGMNHKDACDAAEVSPHTATKWTKNNPRINRRISELAEIASKNAIMKNGLDRSWVIERLMTVVDRCMQAEPVLDRKGNPTGEYVFDSSGANKALQLLGAELGMFSPKEEKPGDEYANLSDADITRLAQELATQTGLITFDAGTQAPSGQEQIIEVHAVPETDRVPQQGGDVSGEAVPSGQPVGQDLEFSLRNRLPPDGAVSGLVEGEAMGEGGDGLGIGRVDGIDTGHDAEIGLGPAGGVGNWDDPREPDYLGQASAGDSRLG
jgi:phage terminase small subunit